MHDSEAAAGDTDCLISSIQLALLRKKHKNPQKFIVGPAYMHCNHKEISKIQDYISFQLHMVLMLRTKKSNIEFVRTAEKNPKFKDDQIKITYGFDATEQEIKKPRNIVECVQYCVLTAWKTKTCVD